MKKYSILSLILICVLVFSGCAAFDSSVFYNEAKNSENLDLYINKVSNKCFVGQYNCTEYTENMEITIPDYWEGVPVTSLGGFCGRGVSVPFYICIDGSFLNAEEGSESLYRNSWISADVVDFIVEEYSVEEISFILNIGKNVSEIKNLLPYVYCPHINEDGSVTYYTPVLEINCDEDNEHFYSKDGQLYDKKTDELIEDFSYKN